MRAIRKILVPVDFSEPSREALRFACDLARRYEAQVTLLHAYQLPGYAFPEGYLVAGPASVNDLLGLVDKALAEARREAEAEGVKVETRAVMGVAFAEIVRAAREGGFDLVVMGTHGRTGLKHALLGSVAEKVVRKAPCPVLTVRPSGHTFVHP
jgi:nucleotide-binding universal stress UspA family protein